MRSFVPVLVCTLTACHLPYSTAVTAAGPLAMAGARPLVVVTMVTSADPRGIDGPPRDVGLVLRGDTLTVEPLDGAELHALQRVLHPIAPKPAFPAPEGWFAFADRVVQVDVASLQVVQADGALVPLAAFDAPSACPAGDVPYARSLTAVCLAPNRTGLAAVRIVDGSCRMVQTMWLDASDPTAHHDQVTTLLPPEPPTQPQLQCALHDDGAVLVVNDEILTLVSPTGAPALQRKVVRLAQAQPVAGGGFALYRWNTQVSGAVELVGPTLDRTGLALVPRGGQYDPVALTTDGTDAVVISAHDALLTTTRVDAQGRVRSVTTIDLGPLTPPALK